MTLQHQGSQIASTSAGPFQPGILECHEKKDSIGGATGSKSGGPWCIKRDAAIKGIENGTWRFWTSVNGNSVWVIIATRNGKKYLKTEADGAEPNNLLSLPRCK